MRSEHTHGPESIMKHEDLAACILAINLLLA